MPFFLHSIASLFLVAFGQSSFIPCFCMGAASFGYAWFWFAITRKFERTRDRFWGFAIWFGLVQLIQLSWFTSIEYMGPLILVVYVVLSALIGLQFGCLSIFFHRSCDLSLLNCFSVSGCWVILEWIRLFFLSGFTWNPVALSLADSSYAIQFASIFGVYGLSFWVLFVNAFALCIKKSWKKGVVWVFLALTPYLYGAWQQEWVQKNVRVEQVVSAALVQTAILPEQKDRFVEKRGSFIPPLNQWMRIWEHLYRTPSLDLIVLPEAAVSQGARRPIYPLEAVKAAWARYFGHQSFRDFPPLEPPFAVATKGVKGTQWKVTNAFLVQALANHFQTNVIIGLDDQEAGRRYNAAFFFAPQREFARYEKRILVPVGEYIPFLGFQGIADFFSEQFGIGDAFDCGGDPNVFFSSFPIGVSICLEETYGHLLRELRMKGARLFVNVSNDVWFPKSRLPEHHFQHGRIRAAENGVPVLRSCNTGITGFVDCCGKTVEVLPQSEEKVDVLYCKIPLRSFQTLYTIWGDGPILCCSLFFLLVGLCVNWYTLRRSFNTASSQDPV